jgi:hypothetical protein
MSRYLLFVLLLLATSVVLADEASEEAPEAERVAEAAEPAEGQDETPATEGADDATATQEPKKEGTKELSGMSILGNQEAPKSLVIVPWKSSGIGETLGISAMLDDSRQPVDKEVFMRALSYYEIRSETKP